VVLRALPRVPFWGQLAPLQVDSLVQRWATSWVRLPEVATTTRKTLVVLVVTAAPRTEQNKINSASTSISEEKQGAVATLHPRLLVGSETSLRTTPSGLFYVIYGRKRVLYGNAFLFLRMKKITIDVKWSSWYHLIFVFKDSVLASSR
jgi:hypothetical protein